MALFCTLSDNEKDSARFNYCLSKKSLMIELFGDITPIHVIHAFLASFASNGLVFTIL